MGPIKLYKFVFESRSSSSEEPYYKYYKGEGKSVIDAFNKAANDFLNDYPYYRA